MDSADTVLVKLYRDRILAHETLFGHRHSNRTPDFHKEIITDWHSPIVNLAIIAFRGGAKSSRAEEAIVIGAMFRQFHNCLLLGSSLDRACERLHAIRREFEKNELIRTLIGDVRGQPWSDEKIELTTGVVIQAIGRGQAIRGTKEEVVRPDLIVADDIEDKQSVSSPEQREKIQSWFLGEIMPAGDVNCKVRMLANDMDVDCLVNRLDRPGTGFVVRRYPWITKGKDGREKAAWPDRFPLSACHEIRTRYYSMGRARDYEMEYMCHSETQEAKPFKKDMFRVEPQVRTWQNVYCMFDPARTVNRNSATTGFAAWSFIGGRLIIWDSWARKLLPDEIVSSVFQANEEFQPAWIGVEEDGLNEFLLQPIRHEMMRRGYSIPLKAVKAPKSKMDFIRGLQPFFNAREVIFVQPLPDLEAQLLSFPTGDIDAPNALAYAPRLKGGAPMYEDFSARNVAEEIRPTAMKINWLALNATYTMVTGVLLQILDGGVIRIYADFVREGEPSDVTRDILAAAQLEATGTLRCVAGPAHFNPHRNFGLIQAVKAIPKEIQNSLPPEGGRTLLRDALQREVRGFPALLVSRNAQWTLNGLAGGYARALLKQGMLADYPEEGHYRVLMEGLESCLGLLRLNAEDDNEEPLRYGRTPDGRRYVSALR